METTALKMFDSTIRKDENDRIFVQPLCAFFKIDTDYQVEKIKNDQILGKSYEKNRNNFIFGDNYPRVSLDKKGFLRWIQLLNPNTVEESLRETFILYQELVFDYLYGSTELHLAIKNTRRELEVWNTKYSESGIMIQRKKKELDELLNNMFQYKLPFEEQKQIK